MPQTARVELGERSYEVRIGPGLMDALGPAAVAVGSVRQAVIVSDSTVAGLYGRRVVDSVSRAGVAANVLQFPAGESHKTLATAGGLFDRLFAIEPAVDRNCLIVALGGGVPGDLAGFLAATALRGLRWLQCPTTLHADVDASVGGKTGVDHPAGKNLIGAFHQPSGVIIDVETLRTLPAPELQSGLAECVKHAMIRDGALLDFIETNADAIARCDAEIMTELIARNVAIKAGVVADDEREAGRRAHLNFGHTIGHAIEACEGYGRITHGQAVALGMVAACILARRKGLVDSALSDRLEAVLRRVGLATRHADLPAEKIWDIMQHDKKARDGKVRFVLPTALGAVEIFDDVSAEDVKEVIRSLA